MNIGAESAFGQFLDQVEQARKELRCSKSGAFFRGHTKDHYKLVPSLLRNEIGKDTEHNLYVDCYARGQHLMPAYRNSWEFLSLMQHFGIPTRLLDWSESLATALFFALSEDITTPHIWITNGFLLNKSNKVAKDARILTIGLDKAPDYEECFVSFDSEKNWPFKKPVFLQIPWSSERMVGQKGFFTVHADGTPMEESCKRYIRKVDIPTDAVPGARRFLEYAGVNEDTIYPDLEGFGRFLRKRYLK